MNEILAGVNSVTEALKGRRRVHKIYIQSGRQDKRIDGIIGYARAKGIDIQLTDKNELNKMCKFNHHQGVLALVDAYTYASIDQILNTAISKGEQPFVLVLDGVEDPQNLGSIIRTAECAGVHGIIIPKHNSAEITEATARASVGAVEHINIARETNLVNAIKNLKNHGLWIIGADMNSNNGIFSTKIPNPLALVIGGEGKGIRRLVKENCDLIISIPLLGSINSLNVSVAAGLIIYEILRQNHK